MEDEDVIDMEVDGLGTDFCEEEDGKLLEDEQIGRSSNNNATVECEERLKLDEKGNNRSAFEEDLERVRSVQAGHKGHDIGGGIARECQTNKLDSGNNVAELQPVAPVEDPTAME